MKRAIVTAALVAGLATASIAEPAKSRMSAKQIEQNMVVSTQSGDVQASSSAALVILGVLTALVFIAAATGSSRGVESLSYPMSY